MPVAKKNAVQSSQPIIDTETKLDAIIKRTETHSQHLMGKLQSMCRQYEQSAEKRAREEESLVSGLSANLKAAKGEIRKLQRIEKEMADAIEVSSTRKLRELADAARQQIDAKTQINSHEVSLTPDDGEESN